MIKTDTQTAYLTLQSDYSISEEDIGKTLTFSADILNKMDNQISLQINTGTLDYIPIPVDSQDTYSISKLIPDDCETIQCILACNGARIGKVFTDNWKLIIE